MITVTVTANEVKKLQAQLDEKIGGINELETQLSNALARAARIGPSSTPPEPVVPAGWRVERDGDGSWVAKRPASYALVFIMHGMLSTQRTETPLAAIKALIWAHENNLEHEGES